MKAVATFAAGALVASVARAQVVQWDIHRRQTGTKIVRRQDGTVTEVITNEKLRGGYFASCAVGTPPQNLTLQLDTGSSDIWVPSSSSSVCQETTDNAGCSLGSFDESDSTSFSVVGQNQFSISYVDGSHSKGDYIAETFAIGDATLTNMTMGLGVNTDIPYGLVGVGYVASEAIVGSTRSTSSTYDNLPVKMQKQGLIATNAYSLWLNDLDASKGSILFGGIDTEKYHGDLTRINIYKDSRSGVFSSFTVALTSVQASSPSGTDSLSSEFPIPVVLDSGTTFSYLPTDLAEQIWQEVGANYYDEVNLPLLPCSMANSQGHFSFGFGGSGGPVINVTMDELVLPLNGVSKFEDGPNEGEVICQFGIQNFSSSSATFLLGDTFLRSAYVVYDLVNNEVAIAPTDFNSTTSNIVAFPSLGAQIPSATAAPNQAEVTQSSSLETPSYGASGGFHDSAASLPPPLDWSRIAIMGASMGLMMVGSGFFLLF
ncbi:acid protease [Daldinia vernicosa]|uniref:acid protease n=1 Tax=Daldinia vernicosa TaxID=114800 RepID=UPI002007A951|nr:acid protease [Daldinia vernicosa]KAI0845721.1 acid protease [Daldinia vernicosa]